MKLQTPLFFYKWIKFEYWPWWFFYLPMLPYWLVLAIRSRSLTYFTAVNPGIELGGFFGESKSAILAKIPSYALPKQWGFSYTNEKEFVAWFDHSTIQFPVVVKPDVGERGTNVEKIESFLELAAYLSAKKGEKIIVQEFITSPEEFGVLYSRMPNESNGKITSITQKGFLSVIGNGKSSVQELLNQTVRGRFQIKRLLKEKTALMKRIPEMGEYLLVEPIGNHCRGTAFIDANNLNTKALESFFNTLSVEIDGFYFGRFDVKATSEADFSKGKGICVMELNGASSEPGHIYDSSNSVRKAYLDLAWHWKRMAEIAAVNRKNPQLKSVSFSTIIRTYVQHVIQKKRVDRISIS